MCRPGFSIAIDSAVDGSSRKVESSRDGRRSGATLVCADDFVPFFDGELPAFHDERKGCDRASIYREFRLEDSRVMEQTRDKEKSDVAVALVIVGFTVILCEGVYIYIYLFWRLTGATLTLIGLRPTILNLQSALCNPLTLALASRCYNLALALSL